MKKFTEQYQEYIEWEVINETDEISEIVFENEHYKVNPEATIVFSRDLQYKLVATLQNLNAFAEINRNHGELGSIVENENLIGYSRDKKIKYRINGVVLSGASTNHNFESNTTTIKSDVIFNSIEKVRLDNHNKTSIIHEWYLCGKPEMYFPRGTNRKIEKKHTRTRLSIDDENDFKTSQSQGGGNDFFLIETENISVLVGKVPEIFGPNWSFNLVFEYREALKPIPDKQIREAISELVGFIFGHQLFKIGEASYSDSYYFTEQHYQNPNGMNVVNICKKMGFTPVNIHDFHRYNNVEILINRLLPEYLKSRDKLKLNGALTKFWLAKYSPLGANLPILSSSVESLAAQILKLHPEKKQYYIEQSKFTKLIKDELESISKKIDTIKLEDPTHREIILNKIKGSSQRGANEKLFMMFEILELPVGEIEKEAIKARNKMAHTSFGDISDEEIIKTIHLTHAYESLFNRIILKILSYDGDYIDYYTLGFPSRNINEFIPKA
ncbi:hypothetical protein KIH23_10095 [Flavobacterium sp. CYK-55]|uniref:hypothetical protein n=1 Tax=Flavobacterium sp. CYK-55 TaxID=2835529 RepID=UPI001BD05F92|nr:hypothetical protein [Flavobacterium sp. CYK-55]MBS7787648.1 hypothetical protein [Flavobacterium sp. CYK-55]